ncbi:MAG: sarcinarray family MAST domain-containing protein [ANME-2 cluster archaeon]|nr:sarcinarray family MAST domain-containing protein [ANME-2 cluster archaeon]
MNINILKIALIISILLICIQNSLAAENDFGKVIAWANNEPATVEGIELKINEPFIIKADIESKIDGNVYVQLYEPGVTKAYIVIEGPSQIDEWVYNSKVLSGWKKTYIWTVKPNGEWTDGKAPLNLFVQFNKAHDEVESIEFTIANPYILDEQYSGPAPTTTDPSSTDLPPSQGSPGFGVAGALLGIMLAVGYRFGKN